MRFIFVGGSQRSGTTLLQKVLCQSPASTPRHAEASYLRMLMQAYAQARADFEHDTASYFDSVEDFRQFHAGLVNALLCRTLARYPDAGVLVLKEPHLTQTFPLLYELVPEARFLLVMRDPRDIMASMISVGERMATQGQQHFFQQRDIAQLSQLIKSFYAPTLNSKHEAFRKQTLTVRYEDLVQNSGELLPKLSAFTGLALPADAAALVGDRARGSDAAQPRYAPWYTDNSEQPLNPSSVARYREVLTAREIAAAEEHCADIIELFKY